MANPTSETTKAALLPGCAEAFAALKTYDRGAPRAALLPIDQAAIASLRDSAARDQLEAQLVRALQAGGSVVAREYVCAKLALIGTSEAVPALSALLSDSELATAARNALEAIPGPAAAKALRNALSKVTGLLQVGVMQSLGVRQDASSVSNLRPLLGSAEVQIASAAAAALAEIGSVKAGRALRDFFSRAPESVRRGAADALLVCARRLSEQGRKTDAETLLKLLLTPAQPGFIRQAAEKTLACASGGELRV